MIIKKIELTHFGKFHLKVIDFTPGLNVVYGRNEAGKSTIHAFVRSMLFGISDSAQGREIYEKYLPWESPEDFKGRMWIVKDGHCYRIERCFLKEKESLKLVDETAGEALEPAARKLKGLLEGLTENNYLNTICIEQLEGSSEPQLADELSSLMINAGQSRSVRINVEKAKSLLTTRREKLANALENSSNGDIESCDKQISEVESKINQLQKQKYIREGQKRELSKKLEEQKKQADEEMLSYERERDELRRSYEAAKKAYDNAPQTDEDDLKVRNYSWITLLVLTILFFGAAVYMYIKWKLSTQMYFNVTTALACFSFMCLVGTIVAYRRAERDRESLVDNIKVNSKLKRSLEESITAFEECKKREPQSLEERCKPLLEKQTQADMEVTSLVQRLDDEWKNHSRLSDKSRKLKQADETNQKLKEEIEAVDLALNAITRVTTRNHDTFGNLLNNEASKLLSQITNGKYDKVTVGRDMKVMIHTGDRSVPIEGVSRGTIEQVYLCMRVAAAKLLWQKEAMPFLFDDVFAYYDDERLEAAMRMLKSCGHQTIIFSCHQREDRLL